MIIYFETSAINYFSKTSSFEAAERVFNETKKNGASIRTSSISLWEILLSKTPIDREELIAFMQNFIPAPLLSSPEEIIVSYLKQGSPLMEPKRDLVSETDFAKVWYDIMQDKRKTFVFEYDELKRRHGFAQKFSKSLRDIATGKMGKLDSLFGLDLSTIFDQVIKNLKIFKENPEIDAETLSLYRLALFFALVVLCANLTLESQITKAFWQELNIEDTEKRFFYFLNNHSEAIYRGPFAVMAKMALYQSKRSHSRGLWMDALHSVYLPYSDMFVSTDEHFKDMRDGNEMFKKISYIPDLLK